MSDSCLKGKVVFRSIGLTHMAKPRFGHENHVREIGQLPNAPAWPVPEPSRQKITFGEMRATGVRGLLIYCSDYRCSHSVAISGDRWSDDVRLSDIEPLFTCQTCGRKGADVRPNFDWEQEARRARLSGRHTSGLTKTVGSTSPSMAAVSVRMICG